MGFLAKYGSVMPLGGRRAAALVDVAVQIKFENCHQNLVTARISAVSVKWVLRLSFGGGAEPGSYYS